MMLSGMPVSGQKIKQLFVDLLVKAPAKITAAEFSNQCGVIASLA